MRALDRLAPHAIQTLSGQPSSLTCGRKSLEEVRIEHGLDVALTHGHACGRGGGISRVLGDGPRRPPCPTAPQTLPISKAMMLTRMRMLSLAMACAALLYAKGIRGERHRQAGFPACTARWGVHAVPAPSDRLPVELGLRRAWTPSCASHQIRADMDYLLTLT